MRLVEKSIPWGMSHGLSAEGTPACSIDKVTKRSTMQSSSISPARDDAPQICWMLFGNAGILALVLIALFTLATPSLAALSLVWSDEFDGTSLDTDNWTIDIGDGCPDLCGWGNNELEYYLADNVTVADGNLTLTTRQQYYGGRQYTSGKVHTRDKQVFLYGRMEMRAKIPTGGGMWPAFWMMPQDDVYGGWASSGEIDIMEAANATTSIGGTIHYGGSWPENASSGGSYSLGGANFADEYHVYAVEWEPEEIRWYVDDVLYSTKYSWQWYSSGAPDNPLAPFDQDFYIILNAAIGGDYTGCTSPSCITADLPQEFLIDYVRVYQETGNEAPAVTITAPTAADNPPAGDIIITAAASDPDGEIATVEFYAGTTYLGEDTIAPYTFTWNAVDHGCYFIAAKAIDDEGAFSSDTVDITVGDGCGQAPFPGAPPVFPARVEAEDFDIGGEGIAYHDTDEENLGGRYRLDEAVDIQDCNDTDGGFNLGWIYDVEWLEYTVEVPADGEYPIDVRVASPGAGGTFHIEFGGMNRTGDVDIPGTGGWQNWTTVSTTATLQAGVQVMRFVPTLQGFNLNYFDITVATPVPDAAPAALVLHPCYPNPFNPATTISFVLPVSGAVDLAIYDVTGKLVKRLVAGDVVAAGHHDVQWNGRTDSGIQAASGTYFTRLIAHGEQLTRRMTLLK